MSKPSQRRAVEGFRNRLAEKGLSRFEVIGRNDDRELVRALARRLAEGDGESDHLRSMMNESLGREHPSRGAILRALMASPLVGSELDLSRRQEDGRAIDL